MTHPLLQDRITISGNARDQQYDRYVNEFDCIRIKISLLI